MNYLGIKLTKDMKGLYTKNNKSWIRDLNKEKDICVNELEDLLLLRCPFYLKPSADPIQSLLQLQPPFCAEMEKEILKFRWELQGDPKVKTILKQQQKVGGLSLLMQAFHTGAGTEAGQCWPGQTGASGATRERRKGKHMLPGTLDVCKGMEVSL